MSARVLVTGPVGRLAEYAAAARSAGWQPIEHPLLAIEPAPFDASALAGRAPDWIALTSSNALAWLAAALEQEPGLASLPCAAVGEETAARARALGLEVALSGAPDAAALAEALSARAAPRSRVLWPRGNLSNELARGLRARDLDVLDVVAYRTKAGAGGLPPAAEAVFFASPSAVRAWTELAPPDAPPVAIAIGASTFDSLLAETAVAFADTISLPEPTPEAFASVLLHLDAGRMP